MGTALYVLALMTSINCGVDVICLRPVEVDSTGQHAETYPTEEACTAARDRFSGQHDATHHLNLRCVPENVAVPYDKQRSALSEHERGARSR
jgi:hypothetical protein